ncbi:MAG: ABC-F family ATP-binding cassette domain-containing protein [Pseudomonadota bacterium]
MIQLKTLTLRRGAKVVLDDVTLTLQPGEKAALVGRNGAGKSSLFALLTGKLHADAGEVLMPPTWRMAEVAQSMPETAQPATEFVLEGDTRLMAAQAALRRAEADGDGHAVAEAHALLAEAGAFDARSRAQTLLMGLGFAVAQLDAPVDSFSGGWRMRLQLARALMCPADLLLLDEPTNHLDLDALVWLEGWLKRYEGTLLVISHDREFLDAVTRVTLHLDNAKLTRWGGNYSAFELMHAQAQAQQQAAYSRQQERIAQLTRFIDRFKAKATKARQAQSRVKALERMEKLAPVLAAREFAFSFQEPPALPNPMLVMRDVACGYMPAPVAGYGDAPPAGAGVPSLGRPGAQDAGAASNGRAILTGITASVLPGQRIGILGANGQGKSTLVKTLAHELAPLAGTVTEGRGLAIGYFAQQEMDLLRPDEGALAHLIRLAKQVSPTAREQELRDFLGGFAFGGDMATQPIGTMSGGEKARLVLALLVWQRPNLLLLDEPTNHLDLTTREALSVALNEFEGTVMLVSHDRALLREVCDEFWLVAQGSLRPFDGDLDDYQRWLAEQARAAARALAEAAFRTPEALGASASSASRRDERKAQAQARQKLAEQTRPIKAEMARIEQAMEQAQAGQAQALERLGDAALSPAERADLGRQLKQIEADLAGWEERWLELSTQLDALANP